MTEQDFNKAGENLSATVTEARLFTAVFDEKIGEVIAIFGADSMMTRAVEWARNLGKKYMPILEAIMIAIKSAKPLLFIDGKYNPPGKLQIWKKLKLVGIFLAFLARVIKFLI